LITDTLLLLLDPISNRRVAGCCAEDRCVLELLGNESQRKDSVTILVARALLRIRKMPAITQNVEDDE
jgi:hypothetical protein